MLKNILIVDDDKLTLGFLKRALADDGFGVEGAENGEEAIAIVRDKDIDLVITDLQMPKIDGITLLRELKRISPKTISIVMTGFATVKTAVEAMKAGAFDYVSKPFQIDEMRLIVKRAFEYRQLRTENISLKSQLKKKYKFANIIGDHPLMQQVFRLIERVAGTNSMVLITGETGTGKELVARAIHYNSDRSDKLLIPVNCGAIPEALLESELFGYVKGAFTGATTNRIGRFGAAYSSTIFLDEVGEMSPSLQVKILRVLQSQEFEPVGSSKPTKVDVRVIAATNIDLEKAVKAKKFRQDLYYRLNVIPIHLPPLREKRTDIPLLINHFLEHFREEKMRDIKPLDDSVMSALISHDWPGNVRELENLIERLVILSEDGMIHLTDLPRKVNKGTGVKIPDAVVIPEEGLNFNEIVGEFEDKLIMSALERSRGNKNMAARLLNLKRTTLVEKIKKKGLEDVFNKKHSTAQEFSPGK